MEISLQQITEANQSGVIDAADKIFGAEFKPGLIHQVVTAYLSAGRAGTKAQKTRSQVSGGGAKPFRQKGTGRARAGTTRAPQWRGGGMVFASAPRDYSQKVNKKMYRVAIRSILSELLRQERLVVVDDFVMNAPKTKELASKLKSFGDVKVLIVPAEVGENLFLAARNLYKVAVVGAKQVDPVTLVSAEKVLMTVSALKQFEEVLA